MSFKLFTVKELSTTDRERDTDTESFKVISSFATKYFTVNKTKIFASNIDSESLTICNLNMRSIYNKENFFEDLKFDFSAICLSETPCVTIDAKKNSTYKLNEYRSFHQIWYERKGGGLCIFLCESYT